MTVLDRSFSKSKRAYTGYRRLLDCIDDDDLVENENEPEPPSRISGTATPVRDISRLLHYLATGMLDSGSLAMGLVASAPPARVIYSPPRKIAVGLGCEQFVVVRSGDVSRPVCLSAGPIRYYGTVVSWLHEYVSEAKTRYRSQEEEARPVRPKIDPEKENSDALQARRIEIAEKKVLRSYPPSEFLRKILDGKHGEDKQIRLICDYAGEAIETLNIQKIVDLANIYNTPAFPANVSLALLLVLSKRKEVFAREVSMLSEALTKFLIGEVGLDRARDLVRSVTQ